MTDDPRSKRLRVSKACDSCRRKKVKCDAIHPLCTNCETFHYECTYNDPTKKRGPPKGYIEAIEARLHRMEGLLGGLVKDKDPRAEIVRAELDAMAREAEKTGLKLRRSRAYEEINHAMDAQASSTATGAPGPSSSSSGPATPAANQAQGSAPMAHPIQPHHGHHGHQYPSQQQQQQPQPPPPPPHSQHHPQPLAPHPHPQQHAHSSNGQPYRHQSPYPPKHHGHSHSQSQTMPPSPDPYSSRGRPSSPVPIRAYPSSRPHLVPSAAPSNVADHYQAMDSGYQAMSLQKNQLPPFQSGSNYSTPSGHYNSRDSSSYQSSQHHPAHLQPIQPHPAHHNGSNSGNGYGPPPPHYHSQQQQHHAQTPSPPQRRLSPRPQHASQSQHHPYHLQQQQQQSPHSQQYSQRQQSPHRGQPPLYPKSPLHGSQSLPLTPLQHQQSHYDNRDRSPPPHQYASHPSRSSRHQEQQQYQPQLRQPPPAPTPHHHQQQQQQQHQHQRQQQDWDSREDYEGGLLVNMNDKRKTAAMLSALPMSNPLTGYFPEETDANVIHQLVMPAQDVVEHLIDVHFRYVHPVLPMLHHQLLSENLNSRDNSPPPHLLFAVFGLAARFSEDSVFRTPQPGLPRPPCTIFYERAKYFIRDEYDNSQIGTVQALLLMSIQQMGFCESQRAWLHVGMAIRMAQDLGLNKDSDGTEQPFNRLQSELRKRTWWSCYVVERLVCTGLGRPLAISQRDCEASYPQFEDDLDGSPSSASGMARRAIPTISYFVHLITLSHLQGNILEFIKARSLIPRMADGQVSEANATGQGQSGPLDLSQKAFDALDKQLFDWKFNLPEALQMPTPQSVHFGLFLHLTFNTVVILLHRPEIPYSDLSATLCEAAADTITDITEWLMLSRSMSSMFISCLYSIFSAGVVHFMNIPSVRATTPLVPPTTTSTANGSRLSSPLGGVDGRPVSPLVSSSAAAPGATPAQPSATTNSVPSSSASRRANNKKHNTASPHLSPSQSDHQAAKPKLKKCIDALKYLSTHWISAGRRAKVLEDLLDLKHVNLNDLGANSFATEVLEPSWTANTGYGHILTEPREGHDQLRHQVRSKVMAIHTLLEGDGAGRQQQQQQRKRRAGGSMSGESRPPRHHPYDNNESGSSSGGFAKEGLVRSATFPTDVEIRKIKVEEMEEDEVLSPAVGPLPYQAAAAAAAAEAQENGQSGDGSSKSESMRVLLPPISAERSASPTSHLPSINGHGQQHAHVQQQQHHHPHPLSGVINNNNEDNKSKGFQSDSVATSPSSVSTSTPSTTMEGSTFESDPQILMSTAKLGLADDSPRPNNNNNNNNNGTTKSPLVSGSGKLTGSGSTSPTLKRTVFGPSNKPSLLGQEENGGGSSRDEEMRTREDGGQDGDDEKNLHAEARSGSEGSDEEEEDEIEKSNKDHNSDWQDLPVTLGLDEWISYTGARFLSFLSSSSPSV